MAERVFGHAIVVPNSALGDAVALELCLPGAAREQPAQRRPSRKSAKCSQRWQCETSKQLRGFGCFGGQVFNGRENERSLLRSP